MQQVGLRYGCNPHQGRARLVASGTDMPLTVLNGSPGYINILDALTAWQLVGELKATTGKASAASFKHVSPAGAAISGAISESFARSQFLSGVPRDSAASAYVKARGADRMSSFGDAAAVSESVGPELAAILKSEVSDLVIAPEFEPEALDILRTKKAGQYLILQMDPDFVPQTVESRDVFGLRLEQERNDRPITPELFASSGRLPDSVLESLVVATTALKYTQANSVCVAYRGQVIGIGAGQQSRIHCTRIACAKAREVDAPDSSQGAWPRVPSWDGTSGEDQRGRPVPAMERALSCRTGALGRDHGASSRTHCRGGATCMVRDVRGAGDEFGRLHSVS